MKLALAVQVLTSTVQNQYISKLDSVRPKPAPGFSDPQACSGSEAFEPRPDRTQVRHPFRLVARAPNQGTVSHELSRSRAKFRSTRPPLST